MVAFLGTGLLGSGFVKALLAKGNEVQVWNRTSEKAEPLVTAGATVLPTPAVAVAGASRVHLALSDDAAVDAVLNDAKEGLAAGTIIIDHTTTSTAGAKQRTEYWHSLGYTYLHAPVFMGPQNALEGTGFMMVSGDQAVIMEVSGILQTMTGKLLNLGEEVGKAAGIKLMGNGFLLFLTAGLSDTLALGKAMGIQPSEFAQLLSVWNPGSMVPARLARILADQFTDPSWELAMARKDARLMMKEASQKQVDLATIPAIAAEMDKWIEKGFAHHDWTVIAKDNI